MYFHSTTALGKVLNYGAQDGDPDDYYKSAYFYVGGNALINTFGRTNYEWGSNISSVPKNASRDFDVYGNENMYIGGSLFANSKVYFKQNVTCVIAGQQDIFTSDGGVISKLFEAYTYGVSKNYITNLINGHGDIWTDYHFFVYQLIDVGICSKIVVNGSMYVDDTAKIRDMTQTYVYGTFFCGDYFELGKSLDDTTNDNTWALKAGFRDANDSDTNYYYKNAGYMYVQGDFDGDKYVKVYASTRLRINGKMDVSRYLTLRHDAKLYVGETATAGTSIDGGQYCEMYINGKLQATTSTCKIRDQARVTVNGNLIAASYIELGKYDEASARGNKVVVNEGGDPLYGNEEAEQSSEGTEVGDNNNGESTGEGSNDYTTLDTSVATEEYANDLNEDKAVGGEYYIAGVLASVTSYIKQFAFSSTVVGDYVFTPKYLTLRHNSDLWVIPEAFKNTTYVKIPFVSTSDGSLLGNIWDFFRRVGYEVNEGMPNKDGCVYTLGELTVNRNASLIATRDCAVLGQCVLRPDSLVYVYHDFYCDSPSLNVSIDALKGNTSLAGFDSYGEVNNGYQYTCTNKLKHDGHFYTMTTLDSTNYAQGSLVCDDCGTVIDVSTRKKVQVSSPAVVYAYNKIYIDTTVDMRLTYLVAERGSVDLVNVYTKTVNAEKNAKELPNAICSYYSNINYFAMYGKLGALFYAPNDNILFDGYYNEIWGCVLGDTVKMDAYYMAFHRFENWRTMDLRIAESSNIYIVPKKDYEAAEDNVDDIYMYDPNYTLPTLENGGLDFGKIFGFN